MIFAVVGAVNGQLDALERALDFIEQRGILLTLQAGDVAVGGEAPNEVIALLALKKIPCVQGEQDRELIRFARKPQSWRARWDEATLTGMSAARDRLSSRNLEWLNALPRTKHLEAEGKSICLCHGSPASQAEIVAADLPLAKFERLREMEPVDVLLCGGASESFAMPVAESLVCGIGPLRSEEDRLEVCFVSTEGAQPTFEVISIA